MVAQSAGCVVGFHDKYADKRNEYCDGAVREQHAVIADFHDLGIDAVYDLFDDVSLARFLADFLDYVAGENGSDDHCGGRRARKDTRVLPDVFGFAEFQIKRIQISHRKAVADACDHKEENKRDFQFKSRVFFGKRHRGKQRDHHKRKSDRYRVLTADFLCNGRSEYKPGQRADYDEYQRQLRHFEAEHYVAVHGEIRHERVVRDIKEEHACKNENLIEKIALHLLLVKFFHNDGFAFVFFGVVAFIFFQATIEVVRDPFFAESERVCGNRYKAAADNRKTNRQKLRVFRGFKGHERHRQHDTHGGERDGHKVRNRVCPAAVGFVYEIGHERKPRASVHRHRDKRHRQRHDIRGKLPF